MGRWSTVSAALAASASGLLLLAGCGGATTARSASPPAALSCLPALRLLGPSAPPPRAVAAPLDHAVLARYALFRRAAQPGDALLPDAQASAALARKLAQDFTLARWYPAELRALGTSSRGLRYYAFPAFGRREAVPPGCRPASARRELAAQQQRRLVEPVACLVAAGPGGAGPLGCEPFAEIEAAADVFASGGRTDPLVSLVPDGVAALRISYRTGQPITVPVVGNAIVVAPPAPSPRLRLLQRRAERLSEQTGGCWRVGHEPQECGSPHLGAARRRRLALRLRQARAAYELAVAAADPAQIQWLDARGRVARTLRPPPRAFLAGVDVGDLRAPIGG